VVLTFSLISEPLFLSCAETDHTFDTPSRRRAIDILHNEKKVYELQVFSGVEHGFALRGDMNNPYERKSTSVDVAFRTLTYSCQVT
jgi:dienelactone hydrolase